MIIAQQVVRNHSSFSCWKNGDNEEWVLNKNDALGLINGATIHQDECAQKYEACILLFTKEGIKYKMVCS